MKRRSECPISFGLDLFGDRWTLLVVRDLALKGKHTFSALRGSEEGIASNILSDRLTRLERRGLVEKQRDPDDGRRTYYRLTDAGLDLIPVLVEVIVWSANHDPDSVVPKKFLRDATQDRARLIARLRSAARQ